MGYRPAHFFHPPAERIRGRFFISCDDHGSPLADRRTRTTFFAEPDDRIRESTGSI